MSVNSNGINHSALKLLIEAEVITSTTVFAEADQWMLKVSFAEAEKVVLAKNSGKPRIWRKLDTLAKYLSKLGVITFDIDMVNYDPSQKTLTRPDSSVTLIQAHKAHKFQQEKDFSINEDSAQAEALAKNKSKASWEERRARILQLEDPRVK